jgi:hypothetical protein
MKAIITNEEGTMKDYQESLDKLFKQAQPNNPTYGIMYKEEKANLQSLVDKSIPMKIYRQDEDGVLGECPCCSDRIDMSCRHYQKESPNHCPNCGQKLDWSDSNE